jgi:hypothetical protein
MVTASFSLRNIPQTAASVYRKQAVSLTNKSHDSRMQVYNIVVIEGAWNSVPLYKFPKFLKRGAEGQSPFAGGFGACPEPGEGCPPIPKSPKIWGV